MDTLRLGQHLINSDSATPPEARELFERAVECEASGRVVDAWEIFQSCVDELEAAEAPEAAVVNHKLAVFE